MRAGLLVGVLILFGSACSTPSDQTIDQLAAPSSTVQQPSLTTSTTTVTTTTVVVPTTTSAAPAALPRGHDAHAGGQWMAAADERAAYTDDRTPTEYSFFDWRNETRPGWGPSRIGFLIQCDGVLVDQVDPIVDPGAPRSAHLHEFFGNPTVTPNSSTQSLADASRDKVACTDVNDKSAYWSPMVYQDGTATRATTFSAYYKSPVAGVEPMPFGLRMVAGDAQASANQSETIGWWEIAGKKGINTRDSDEMIERPAGAREVQLRVNFPQCWDGIHLDSPDHSSHMAYAAGTNGCPATHPVRVPQLVTFTTYDVAGGNGFELASGAWYTFHQDFWNAWAPDQMAELIDRCIDDGLMCRVRTTPRLLGLGQYVDAVPAG